MQLKSKQRARDHGEVYTHEREVNAMLDLVADQAANPDKTFLEPACGNGNFLAEILRRKLAAVLQKHKKSPSAYERTALIALGSLYGIELLPDNTAECRARLHQIFAEAYQAAFPNTFKPEYLHTAQYILDKNIICADALRMQTADGVPIVLAEWKAVNGSFIKRRDYQYQEAVNHQDNQTQTAPQAEQAGDLFSKQHQADPDKAILKPYKAYPLVHYLKLRELEHV